jgi:LAGLIDADG-like domain
VSDEKSETGLARLAWPPLADDLRRLYLEQKLSASKIASIYGLKYASAKTAESTILYHLKRHGISRRDPAAHIKKVTETTVDDWIDRYRKGESLKQIAADSFSPVTVFTHLHSRGLELRDKIEAQIDAVTKHEKRPFTGDALEEAYLIGLAIGDLNVTRHGRAIRARLSTTHPRMAQLFRSLFSEHGPIYEYPKPSQLSEFEWCLDCDLDSSFEFLLHAEKELDLIFEHDELFLNFLGGFFDAEGTIYYHKKRMGGAFEFALSNTNETLLRRIAAKLLRLGFSSNLRRVRQDKARALARGVKNSGDFIWKLEIWRNENVSKLTRLIPSRHSEKVSKIKIAEGLGPRPSKDTRARVLEEWDSLKRSIKQECHDYIELASIEYERIHRKTERLK